MQEDWEHCHDARERLEKYVVGKPFGFNPDAELVANILKAMTMRWKKFGEDYCPCRRVTGDKERDADIICPCVWHVQEVEKDGHCHCHLFTRP